MPSLADQIAQRLGYTRATNGFVRKPVSVTPRNSRRGGVVTVRNLDGTIKQIKGSGKS